MGRVPISMGEGAQLGRGGKLGRDASIDWEGRSVRRN